MRNPVPVLALLSGLGLMSLFGCAALNASRDPRRLDVEITSAIRSTLEADDRFRAGRTDVTTQDRVVLLTGAVDTENRRARTPCESPGGRTACSVS